MMYSIKAHAKINLSLDVLDKCDDGYHRIETIMLFVSLSDLLTIQKYDGFECICDRQNIPQNDSNIAIKAAKAFFKYSGLGGGVSISIKKNIPSMAGLGGGSADAAAVLTLLNKIYNTNFSLSELSYIASCVGADVPAAIYGGCVFCEGFGQKLSPLPTFFDLPIVICSPSKGISTKKAYGLLDNTSIAHRPDTYTLIKHLENRNKTDFLKGLVNVFEQVVFLDEIDEIKNIMLGCNAICSHMTGSGSCVFGIFEDLDSALLSTQKLSKIGFKTFLTKPI